MFPTIGYIGNVITISFFTVRTRTMILSSGPRVGFDAGNISSTTYYR